MMGKRMKKRVASEKGFTLAETLVAILILLMVTAIVAAGIPVAANAYEKVVLAGNAQTLLSTAMTRLRDELGTATNITVANGVISYTGETGRNSCIELSSDQPKGICLTEYADAPQGADNYRHLLVTNKAASESLYVTCTGATYTEGSGVLTISGMQVKTKADNTTVAGIDSFEIRILTDLT